MLKELTSRERILRSIRHEPIDRTPVSPFTLGHLRRDDPFTEEFIRATDPFLDVGLGGNIFMGRRIGEYVEYAQEGNDTVGVIKTQRGTLNRRYRRTAVTGYTVEFPCKTADDLLAHCSIPFEPSDPDPTHFHAYSERVGDEGFVLGGIPNAVCFPAEVMSPEDFCLLWADDPELFTSVVNECQKRLIKFVEKASRAGVNAYRIVGAEYVTEQLGPAAFDALCLEQDRELAAVIHDYDGIAYYHCHGDVSRHLETFALLGMDALDPLEVEPYGDVDLGDAKRRVGDRICLVGGLDDMEVLETRDRETVVNMGRACLEAAGGTGYCLGGTASGTYTEKAARNFMALVEVSKEFGGA